MPMILPLRDRVDRCELKIQLGTVTNATPDMPHGNSIANVDEVANRLHRDGFPRLAELLALAHDCLTAYEGHRVPANPLRPAR